MDCKEFKNKIYNFFDDELNDKQKIEFLNHMDNCDDCKKEFELEKLLRDSINNIELEKLPGGYCKKLHQKLVNCKKDIVKTNHKKGNYFIKYLGLVASIIIVFVGVVWGINDSFKTNKFADLANDRPISECPEETPRANFNGVNEIDNGKLDENKTNSSNVDYSIEGKQYNNKVKSKDNLSKNKIIVSGQMTVNTYNYNEFYEYLVKLIKNNEGYFESSRTYTSDVFNNKKYKNGDIVLRIPQKLFYNIVNLIEDNCVVESKGTNEKDVTKHYYEVDNIIKNLKAQEDSLRRLYDKAKTVAEILQVENELRRIRTEIDSYSIELTNIDDRVSMSILNLYIREVEKPSLSVESGINVWKESKDGFILSIKSVIKFLQCVLVYIISVLPYAIIVFVVIIIAFIVLFRRRKKRSK